MGEIAQTVLSTLSATEAPVGEPTPTATAVIPTVETVKKSVGELVEGLPVWGSKLLIAIAIIVGGMLIVRAGRRLIERVFLQRKGTRTAQQNKTVYSLIQSVFSYVMYFILITAVLGVFGVNLASLLAVAGVGGVALAFGAQTLIKDIISGAFLWGEGNVVVGDVVEIGGLSGEVEAVALRTTTLRNVNGNLYIIPNGEIRTVVNMSRSFKRALVDIPVAYEESLDKVLAVLRDEMERVPDAIHGVSVPPTVEGVLGFDNVGMTVRISVECPIKENWRIEREIRKRVKDRFDQEGIRMPHLGVSDAAMGAIGKAN